MAPLASSASGALSSASPLMPRRTALARLRYAARSSALAFTCRKIESEITLSPSASEMPRTPSEERPWNTRTSVTGKRMHWPPLAVRRTSSFSVQICTSTTASPSSSFMALIELHGEGAGGWKLEEVGEFVAARVAAGGGDHPVEVPPGFLALGQGRGRGDGLALLERKDIDQRFAAGLRRRLRQPPHLFL